MYWIGVDHHKRNTYVTSLKEDGTLYLRRNLSASAETLEAFFRKHPKPFVVGIEATYAWEYVADIVEAVGEEIRVGHALLLKAFAKRHKKNDKIDSALSARLLYRGDFPAIAHPPKQARAKRDLYRQRMELVARRTSAICRAKALADRLGFQATMNLGTLKGMQAFRDLPMASTHETVAASHASFLTFLYHEIKRLEKAIDEIAETTEETQWLMSIAGIGTYLALLIASEVFDVNRFPDSSHFVSYAGLAPGSWFSGGKAFAGHLCPNANKYLRWAFFETVHHYTVACPWAKAKYDRLHGAKGWKTARTAIARHVAIVAYHLLDERRPYRATA